MGESSGLVIARRVEAFGQARKAHATTTAEEDTQLVLLFEEVLQCADLFLIQKLEMLFALFSRLPAPNGDDKANQSTLLQFDPFLSCAARVAKERNPRVSAEVTTHLSFHDFVSCICDSIGCTAWVEGNGNARPLATEVSGDSEVGTKDLLRALFLGKGSPLSGEMRCLVEVLRENHVPFPVLGLQGLRIVKIASGYEHTLFLTQTGHVFEAVHTNGAELELGLQLPKLLPEFGDSSTAAVDIAVGVRHSVAVGACGRVFSWGRGDYGQLGHGRSSFVFQDADHYGEDY
ncbi:unnamed protein product, partial [Amoebophrya sp. A120]|eukprot:GSA120T00006571001.1